MSRAANISFENARLAFRPNFKGEGQFGRGFDILLEDPAVVDKLNEEGWNVRIWTSKEGDIVTYLPVAVRYDNFPPNIFMVEGNHETRLDDDTVGMLDSMRILGVDATITPYHWTTPTGSGIKAYAKTVYVMVEEDPIAAKHRRAVTVNNAMDQISDEDIPF